MKLNDQMRYPHPVLNKYSSDYITGEFTGKFFREKTDNNQLKIKSKLEIDNPDLVQLVRERRAAAGYFLVCRPTYYNYLQKAIIGASENYFDLSLLHGLVTLRPVIWTLSEITGFKSKLIDKEFGDDIRIRKGSIIALGHEFSFSVDSRRFKPFESIFSLSINSDVPVGMIDVDADQNKIHILAETKTHQSVLDMRNLDAGRSVMLTSVYLPVITDIIARIQSGDKSLEANRWYKVFAAKCDELGIEPQDQSMSPLKIAQLLLHAPLKGTIMVMETVS